MRTGSHVGLLDELHAPGCDGQEYSTCRAVVPGPRPSKIMVVYMTWCGECGAADWVEV